MTQQIESRLQDLTVEVLSFLNTELARGQEHTVILPELHVIATNGILKASLHIHDFDGCHPYEYDTYDEAERFAVRSLHVTTRGWGGTQRQIDTEKGPIASDPDALETYRFFGRTKQFHEANVEETALAELLDRLPFMAMISADRLVGYDHDLFVSAARPLEHPVSIPPSSEYGMAEPVMHTPVHALSTYTDAAGNKQTVLAVSRYAFEATARQLAPVPLEHLRFEVTPQADQRLAVFERALELQRFETQDNLAELNRLVDTFNALPYDDRSMGLVVERDFPNTGKVQGMIGDVVNGVIEGVRPPDQHELRTVFKPDTFMLGSQLGQLYVVDETAQKALSAHDIFITTEEEAQEKIRFR